MEATSEGWVEEMVRVECWCGEAEGVKGRHVSQKWAWVGFWTPQILTNHWLHCIHHTCSTHVYPIMTACKNPPHPSSLVVLFRVLRIQWDEMIIFQQYNFFFFIFKSYYKINIRYEKSWCKSHIKNKTSRRKVFLDQLRNTTKNLICKGGNKNKSRRLNC